MVRISPLVCAAALVLSGCGGPEPTLDTTTDASTEASLKALEAGMSDAERTRFEDDLKIVANVSQFSDAKPPGDGPKAKYHQLNGLTAREIRERTSTLRANLSR